MRPINSELEFQLNGLGVFTLAPFSRETEEKNKGSGLIDLLRSPYGVMVIINERYYELLNVYCKEHFDGHLKTMRINKFGKTSLTQLRCDTDNISFQRRTIQVGKF